MRLFRRKPKTAVKSVSNIQFTPLARDLLGADPRFVSLKNPKQLENQYCTNPVLSSVINLKADYASNAIISVRNIKNGEIITVKDFKRSKAKDRVVSDMFRLINNPNPLQSTKEFLSLVSIFKDVFGNSYIYGNSATDSINIRDIGYMWPVWPQYMKAMLTGSIFDATQLSSIVKNWVWQWGTYTKEFNTEEILHRKEPNVRLGRLEDMVLGESRQVSLQMPLSNIVIAYESRNAIALDRGMRAIISSNSGDAQLGGVPMEDDEKEDVQNDLVGPTGYGFRKGQKQFMVTRHNINVHNIDQDVRKLGLLNEIASDGMAVSERYGVPEILVKLYLKGATFENQESSERRMYQNTTIPETNDRIEDFNVWLKTRDFGYEYIVGFDHIPVLQKNEKDKSEIIRNTSAVYKEMFFGGAITYDQWLQAVGLPASGESWSKKRITEMDENEIQKIKGNYTINESLEENNQNQ
jgi:hypothetical protein